MQYRQLAQTGLEVSVLSYGASSLGSVFKEINEKKGIRSVHAAIDHGINLIDVSPYYGLTKAEKVLGKALKSVPRDKYILSTKAGRFGEHSFNFSRKSIMNSLEESFKRLGTDYVDILFLHDIEFGSYEQVIEEGIPTLEELKQQGKIRFMGVSGLPLSIFEKILDKKDLDVILSYCHYSLNDTSLLSIIPLLEKKNVGLVNASPLSMGLLSFSEVAEWHPADQEIKQMCKKAAEFCEEQGYDLAKLAIQYATREKRIPTTLVSTASEKNIIKNIKWTEEPINEEMLTKVLEILKPIHNKTWASGEAEWQG
ncbi:aldo/keto reductase [Gracilibacillus alcaliphilus]|uniref:aldo/keto reductase n=1 Tax=Gracilibacillus alcaliphilus TaxID=1401441 RepID=UPI00195C28B7|nr:aldo/keto reductase [Gracilibacillus alcaliphilus]MBM7677186.1 aryl-alcohol dehydrogenase-like predicted oxidoreductase [Gracilibacillus alcaliphilus]